jgi:dipeptidyl aminopeptidase/acylaminoacyl peptidase
MLPWARFLHAAGYNVLLFDMRGCGTRDESFIGLGATEPDDVSLAVSLAGATFQTARIAVLGISLGAGVALLAAGQDPAISAVIADSAWTDQDFTLGRLAHQDLGPVRVPLVPYGTAAVNAMVGADATKARPLDVVGLISPRPVLLIHSADDDNATTPLEGARRLYEAARQPKQLWVADRGGHIGAINAFPDEYRAYVLGFLRDAFD